MKFRRNKVKREHSLIENALSWLEDLSHLVEVTDIIPGVIYVSHSSERTIVYKYKTKTGCKILLKSNGSIQEVFVVTKNPDCVEDWIKTQFSTDPKFPVDSGMVKPEHKSSPAKKELSKSINSSNKVNKGLENKPLITSNRTKVHSKKRPYGGVAKIDEREPRIADQLDQTTQKALKNLKRSLENSKSKKMSSKTHKARKTTKW